MYNVLFCLLNQHNLLIDLLMFRLLICKIEDVQLVYVGLYWTHPPVG